MTSINFETCFSSNSLCKASLLHTFTEGLAFIFGLNYCNLPGGLTAHSRDLIV